MLAKSGASLAGTGEAPVERRFEALHTGAMPLIGHTRSSSCCYGVGGHTDCDERPGYGWIFRLIWAAISIQKEISNA